MASKGLHRTQILVPFWLDEWLELKANEMKISKGEVWRRSLCQAIIINHIPAENMEYEARKESEHYVEKRDKNAKRKGKGCIKGHSRNKKQR